MLCRAVTATCVLTWALALTLSAQAPASAKASARQARSAEASAGQARSAQASADAPAPTADDCLACHDDPTLTRDKAGTSVSVKKDAFTSSVHGPLNCVDCHADLAKVELPHPEKLARVDCSACHADQVALYKQSAHAAARAGGSDLAATCASCHGMHDIRGGKDPQSRTYHLNVAATCASCHGNKDIIAKGHIAAGDVASPFGDSIHGKALRKSGLLVAPTCSDCHGPHDIRKKTDPASRVAMANVPATCGKCHEGIAQQFTGSIHDAMLARGRDGAPACQSCHTAHAIQHADNLEWQLTVVNQCGTCHQGQMKTFRDTFHGQITNLGFRAVAACADCHGSHRILPASDPASPIAKANLVKTCGKCHANATANFVKYDPHADKHDRERNAGLFYASKGMQALLLTTFGFFGVHTGLWLVHGLRERRGGRGKEKR